MKPDRDSCLETVGLQLELQDAPRQTWAQIPQPTQAARFTSTFAIAYSADVDPHLQ